MPVPVTAYYWTGRANFGDLLTPLLMAHFAQTEVIWAPVDQAALVCVGSVLDVLPPYWPGIIAGSGKLHPQHHINLPSATVMALRGPLTAKDFTRARHQDVLLADPGLLAAELVAVDKEYLLGIVPHWSDTELEHRPEFAKYNPHIIRPSGDPLEVLREIGRCRKIVSSSLHGIIVADAFGIPRRTEMAKIFNREGGSFKFEDYNASIGVPFEIGLTQEAPRYMIQDKQQGLFDMFAELGRLLA